VKAAAFDYERPQSLSEALALLQQSRGSTKPLAGGQSLVPLMNLGVLAPDMIVDLVGLRELRRVEEERDHLFVGAMVTHAEIEDGRLPDTTRGMLKYVAGCIGSRAIRNRGTIGGSLAYGDPAADWSAVLIALGADVHVVGTTGSTPWRSQIFCANLLVRPSVPRSYSKASGCRGFRHTPDGPITRFAERRTPQPTRLLLLS
jgi:aerobic carbon-monoxide dehydrogenase medium subunit